MLYPQNEEARLAALSLFKILDSGEDQLYDDLTLIASYVAQTPIALISIVDRDRQWFKSHRGLENSQTAREHSFCSHAILQPKEPLIIPDASKDLRFSNNPLVTGNPNIRFYFGAPLLMSDNIALGSLCVIDTKPRELTKEQIDILNALARHVVTMLEIRKNVMGMGKLLAEQDSRLHGSQKTLDDVDTLTTQLLEILCKKETANRK